LETRVAIVPALLAHPGYARWLFVQGEPEGTVGQTVWASDGKDFSVLDVRAPSEVRTAYRLAEGEELRPEVSGRQWLNEATLDQWAPMGALTAFIELHTAHPEQSQIRIPVSGFVRPPIHVTPPAGTYGEVDVTAGKKAVFVVKSFSTEPI